LKNLQAILPLAVIKPDIMSNEIKIGILAIIAIAISFWGYRFIKGKNILLKSNTYTVYYDFVDRMQVGTVVFINGVDVGSVADVALMNDANRTVKVILDLKPSINIPKNTVAVIVATGFMGGKAVMLEYEQPCEGADCAKSGDTLKGEYRNLMNSMVGEESMGTYMSIVQEGLQDILDTLNYALLDENSNSPLARSMKNLDASLANLSSTSAELDALLKASSGDIKGTLDNIESITSNLKANNQKINAILSNADSLSNQLVAADLERTIEEVNQTIAELRKTLGSADQAIGGVSTIVDKINQGEGSLGKLLKDEELYRRINKLSYDADSLVSDIQSRPYRYMPLKSRRKVNKFDKQDAAEGSGN
jgi:phospholipid/cholesterol/gamma-HCH transport system substrate-binding protein